MKKIVALVVVLAFIATLTSCKVKYRRKAEPKGTLAKYKYGAGGFLRYDGYKNVAGDLEIAVAEYEKPGSKVKIQLVGAIHIADFEYYRKMQKILDTSDLVLWEAVLTQGQKLDLKKLQNKNGLYDELGGLLGLSSQLKSIEYDRKHFVHCDISMVPALKKKKGEKSSLERAKGAAKGLASIKKTFGRQFKMKMVEDYLKHKYAGTLIKNGGMDYKSLSKQLTPLLKQVHKYRVAFPNNMSVYKAERKIKDLQKSLLSMKKMVIDQRNAYVMARLRIELMRRRQSKKPFTIAIFYGAAHYRDFEKRLAKIGYQRTARIWFKCWQMNSRKH